MGNDKAKECVARLEGEGSKLAEVLRVSVLIKSVIEIPNHTGILTTEVRLINHGNYERMVEAWTGENNHINRIFYCGNLSLPEVITTAESEHKKYLGMFKEYMQNDLTYMRGLPETFFD